MTNFHASAWQIQAAWLIAHSKPLHQNIALSQAWRMLKEQGHEPLLKEINGPVLKAAWDRGGVLELAPVLFGMRSRIKQRYDTGQYKALTIQEVVSVHEQDGPMVISGRLWKETIERIEQLERWRNHMLTK